MARAVPLLLLASLVLVSFPATASDGREATGGSYLGGSDSDEAAAVEVGPDGSVYVAGTSRSTDYGQGHGGDADSYVTRLSPDLKQVYWTVKMGGSHEDVTFDLAVAPDGSVFVVGLTRSANFPTASTFFDTTTSNPGDSWSHADGFLYKISKEGAIWWSGYLGGSDFDYAMGVDIDASGRPTVVGSTSSCDFPTTSGAYRRVIPGCPTQDTPSDGFVLKVSADGSRLDASTLLGGSAYDHPNGVAASRNSGSVTVVGDTTSADFPTHAGAYRRTLIGGQDGFVAKLDDRLATLHYATYLGGSDFERFYALARDGSSNVYVTGVTSSDDLPTTDGAPQRALTGPESCYGRYNAPYLCSDAFAMKLSPDFSRLVYATYLGTPTRDSGHAIDVDSAGRAHVAGTTEDGNANASVALWILGADGRRVEHAGRLGGSGDDEGWGVAAAGAATYVAGRTTSADFTALSGADRTLGGGSDGFVARVADAGGGSAFSFTHRGGNEWWVEVDVGPTPVAVQAMDTGGAWKTLTFRSWGVWAGSFHVEPGHLVRFRAQDASGAWHESCWFTHPGGAPQCGTTPTGPTFDHKGGNEWWVEARVSGSPTQVQAMDANSAWRTLELRSWGNWAGSFHIEPGHAVRFRAMVDGAWHESCWFTHPAGRTPTGGDTC